MNWAMVYANLRKDIGDVLQDFIDSENGQKMIQDAIEAFVGEIVTPEQMNEAIATAIANVLEAVE